MKHPFSFYCKETTTTKFSQNNCELLIPQTLELTLLNLMYKMDIILWINSVRHWQFLSHGAVLSTPCHKHNLNSHFLVMIVTECMVDVNPSTMLLLPQRLVIILLTDIHLAYLKLHVFNFSAKMGCYIIIWVPNYGFPC